MPQQNPFDQFDQVVTPAASTAPIYGPSASPAKKQEEQYKANADARATDAERRANDAERRANVSEARSAEKDKMGTEAQGKAAAFYGRMLQSDKEWQGVKGDDIDPRGAIRQYVHDNHPDIENTLLNDPKRQQADQAARNFISAQLRVESGAAIAQSEYDNQYRIFFPMPGDSREVIAQKARARGEAMQAMRSTAGPLADKTKDGVIAPVGGAADATIPPGTPPNNGGTPPGVNRPEIRGNLPVGSQAVFGMDAEQKPFDRETYLKDHFGIDGDQEAKVMAFLNQNRGNGALTVDALKSYYKETGARVPPDAQLAALVDNVKKGREVAPIDTTGAEAEYRGKLQSNLDKAGFDPTKTAGYAGRAIRGAEFGLSDELEGVLGAGKALLTNKPVGDGYVVARDTARLAEEQMREKQGWLGTGAELAGGLVGGAGLFKDAATVPGMAEAGAKVGALEGYGRGEGLGGSVVGGLAGGITGGVTGAVLGKVTPKLGGVVSRFLPARATPEEEALATPVIEAGARQGIPIRQPDVRPELRNQVGVIERTDKGGPIIQAEQKADRAAIEGRVAEIGGPGTPGDKMAVGTNVQTALERHGEQTGSQGRGGRLYTKAEKITGNPKVAPTEAIAAIDANIAELTDAGPKANKGLIEYLQDVRSDLSREGGLSITALRNQRTNMRGQIKERNLDKTDAERRVTMVLDAASKDIEAGLADNKPGLAAYKQADDFWRQRADFRKQVTKYLMGPADNPHSPERTAGLIEGMMKAGGDHAKLNRMFDQLEPAERADLAASVAHNLGQNNKGEFSLPIFLNQLDARKGMNPRTVKLIFGEDGAKAIDDLKLIAQAKVDAGSELNRSKTGGTVAAGATALKKSIFATMGFGTAGVPGAVAGSMAQGALTKFTDERAARMLMNPDFTRWLRTMPTTDAAVPAYIARLETVASKAPAIATDARALQDMLSQAFGQSPLRAAASAKDKGDGRRIPIE